MKVLLGLSGGVDSAVAARLLLCRGYEVIGCYLDNGLPGAEAAAEAAAALDIPFVRRDMRAELEREVCAPFVSAYLRGETPNPCVLCNPAVKFPLLFAEAARQGAALVATGHYVRARNGRLWTGHPANDQSYMLCRLRPEQAAALVLPLGSFSKDTVRSLARSWGLPPADRPDSMEICFIPDGDYARYIEDRGDAPGPGDFLYHGAVAGRHPGIHHFTLGQRRHLGIALGSRVYVSEIRPETDQVVLADGDEVWSDTMSVRDLSWIRAPASFPASLSVRIRHSRRAPPPCVLDADGLVRFPAPVRAPTPGQAAAFYRDGELLGGGFIAFRDLAASAP